MFRSCVLLFTIICVQYVFLNVIETHENISDEFGPYELVYNRYEVCKGPKSKDVGIFQFNLEKNSLNEYIGHGNLTVQEQCNLGETKLIAFTVKNGRRSNLFNYRLSNPCEHFAFAECVQSYLQADIKNKCSVKKGSYIFKVNFNEKAKIFFGKSFFYGNFLMKSTILSPKGNVVCLFLDVTLKKIA